MYKIRFILSLIIAISTISMPTCANGMDIEIDYTLETLYQCVPMLRKYTRH